MLFYSKKSKQEEIIHELYDKHRPLMYTIAYRILNDEDLAEDVVHETFLKITRNFNKINLDNPDKARSYLCRVCQTTAYDMYRTLKPAIPVDDLEAYTADTSPQINPEDYVTDKESYDELVEEITKLPPKYREMLFMQRVYHYTAEEIAEILNISKEAAYKRGQRSKAELGKRLAERKMRDD